MKPSQLRKDERASIRINGEIRKLLKKEGLSVQALFDKALDSKIELKKSIKKGGT